MHNNLHIEQKLSLMFIIFRRRGFACEIKTRFCLRERDIPNCSRTKHKVHHVVNMLNFLLLSKSHDTGRRILCTLVLKLFTATHTNRQAREKNKKLEP